MLQHDSFKISNTDKAIEIITILILLSMWTFVIMSYSSLPDQIATHFDFNGKVDDYGSKKTIFILPCLVSFIVFGFKLLIRFPIKKSYLNNLDTEAAAFQYRSTTKLLRIIGLIVTVMFFYISYQIVKSASSNMSQLNAWFIPIMIVSLNVPTIYMAYKFSSSVKKRART